LIKVQSSGDEEEEIDEEEEEDEDEDDEEKQRPDIQELKRSMSRHLHLSTCVLIATSLRLIHTLLLLLLYSSGARLV
jgi:hypothetical protein